MTKYVLDTNVYISALRSPAAEAELRRFMHAHVPTTYLNSVVLYEMMAGATGPAMARDLLVDLAAPFQRTNRIIVPTHNAWVTSGEVIAQMSWHDGLDRKNVSRGFANDVLMAASCRESGMTLITQNERDFLRIQKRIKFEFLTGLPT